MLVWNKQFEIGIPVIDGQHRRIVHYINQVNTIVKSNEDRQAIKGVLSLLIDYTLSHFAFEEALMDEVGYEHSDEHQISHRAFESEIKTMYQRFEKGEDIAETLSEMLLSWLLEHIQEDDVSYAKRVREEKLEQSLLEKGSWVKQSVERYFDS